MEKLLNEILIAILVEQNGYSELEAKQHVEECKGSEISMKIKLILINRLNKMIEFTDHISKLEKGCAPSVSLMDTRINIAKKAIEKFKF